MAEINLQILNKGNETEGSEIKGKIKYKRKEKDKPEDKMKRTTKYYLELDEPVAHLELDFDSEDRKHVDVADKCAVEDQLHDVHVPRIYKKDRNGKFPN